MKHWWDDTDRGKRITRIGTCPSATGARLCCTVRMWKSTALFEGSQSFLACPSENSSIKKKNVIEHWWDDIDTGRP